VDASVPFGQEGTRWDRRGAHSPVRGPCRLARATWTAYASMPCGQEGTHWTQSDGQVQFRICRYKFPKRALVTLVKLRYLDNASPAYASMPFGQEGTHWDAERRTRAGKNVWVGEATECWCDWGTTTIPAALAATVCCV